MGGTRSAYERADRGAAAVEMALVLPVLLLILFGVIDFGRLLNAQITVTEAAREGARAATIDTASPVAAAQARATRAGQNIGTVTVNTGASTFCSPTSAPGDDAKVVVQHEFKWITPVGALGSFFGGGAGYGSTINVKATGVMPCLA